MDLGIFRKNARLEVIILTKVLNLLKIVNVVLVDTFATIPALLKFLRCRIVTKAFIAHPEVQTLPEFKDQDAVSQPPKTTTKAVKSGITAPVGWAPFLPTRLPVNPVLYAQLRIYQPLWIHAQKVFIVQVQTQTQIYQQILRNVLETVFVKQVRFISRFVHLVLLEQFLHKTLTPPRVYHAALEKLAF
jgi:hypothetical protein